MAMAARAGDAARFEAFRALHARETEPAFRRRWLLALASFEDPALAGRAIELAMGDGVPLQDWASFAGGLLSNRTARDPFWKRLRAEWPAVAARLANAPMLLRRVVEAVGSLTEPRHLEEARAFFAATPVDAGPRRRQSDPGAARRGGGAPRADRAARRGVAEGAGGLAGRPRDVNTVQVHCTLSHIATKRSAFTSAPNPRLAAIPSSCARLQPRLALVTPLSTLAR